MGDKENEETQGTVCFFGEQHDFRAISAVDPFSGERLIELRCIKCGTGKSV